MTTAQQRSQRSKCAVRTVLFLPSSSSVALTRLSGSRSRPTISQKIVTGTCANADCRKHHDLIMTSADSLIRNSESGGNATCLEICFLTKCTRLIYSNGNFPVSITNNAVQVTCVRQLRIIRQAQCYLRSHIQGFKSSRKPASSVERMERFSATAVPFPDSESGVVSLIPAH
jgi:hypothetical protein